MAFEVLRSWAASVVMGDINLSWYTIPVYSTFYLLPQWYAHFAYTMSTGKLVVLNPPEDLTTVASSDPALPSSTRRRILRAEAVKTKVEKDLALYALTVVAGNYIGLSYGLMNGLTLGYLAMSLAYIEAYIYSDTATASVLGFVFLAVRQAIFWVAFALVGKQA
ncbi:hypothetical protein Q7P37_009837 [Cladosporium fusiforme]